MASRRVCSIEDCGNLVKARNLCSKHYMRFRTHGDPLIQKRASNGSLLRWLEQHIGYLGNDCLLWPFKSLTRGGYPNTIVFDGKKVAAHRVMCFLVHGEPPTSSHEAAHSCRSASSGCVHPHHMRWATRAENQHDRVKDGTHNRGERCANSKLTESQVKEMRLLSDQISQSALAARFGVGQWQVSRILSGKRWAWLEGL